MLKFFEQFGKYMLLLGLTFRKPQKMGIFFQNLSREMVSIGYDSLVIVSIISVFTGAVTTVQTAYQLTSGLISDTIIGSIVSESTILELSPTVLSLVLAGRVGSNIASEIGTMRVSEQIDAIEVMGLNSACYLILPKVLAGAITVPLLVIISIFLSIGGGIFAGDLTGIVSKESFIQGAQETFRTFNIFFALIKAFTFGFIITSIAAFKGYYTSGGSIEVGRSSTEAVVLSCILIVVFDFLLAKFLL